MKNAYRADAQIDFGFHTHIHESQLGLANAPRTSLVRIMLLAISAAIDLNRTLRHSRFSR